MNDSIERSENAELIRLLDEEISVRKEELKTLCATLDVLIKKPRTMPALQLKEIEWTKREYSDLSAWTAMARKLIFELPTPFKMSDLRTELSKWGFNIHPGVISSWLSRMHKRDGIVKPEGSKKGLWLLNSSEDEETTMQ